MPSAAGEQRSERVERHRREGRGRQPLRQARRPCRPPSSARLNTPVTTVAPTTATSTAGIFFDMTSGGVSSTASVARPIASAVVFVCRAPATKALHLVDEAVRVGGEAEQLGELAHDDRDRPSRSCSRPAPPWRAGPPRSRACRGRGRSRSRPTISAIIPASAMASAGSSVTSSGTIAAKISGATEESGPSTRILRGTEERVADQTGDRRVEAVDGGERRRARRTPCPAAPGSPPSTIPATRSERSHDRPVGPEHRDAGHPPLEGSLLRGRHACRASMSARR